MAQRYCTNCGAELTEDARFCPSCGRPVHETAAVATPEADVSVPPPPQEAQETSERTFLQKWWPLIALLVVIALIVTNPPSGGGGGSSGDGSNNGGGSNQGGGNAHKEAPQEAPGDSGGEATETFTTENYGELFSDPDAHQGANVNVTGQLLGLPEEDGDQIYFQMFADPANVEWNTIVAADDTGLDLNSDDYVRVKGSVRGSFEGENAFGGSVNAVAVDAESVEKVQAQEAVDPTEKSLAVNQTASDQSFTITVEKIEFAQESTRVYITALNGTGRKADFYTFDAKIIQGSTQVDQETPFDYEVQEPQENLSPGVKTEGVVVFGPVDPEAPFQLSFEWSSYNYNITPKPIRFQITP